ncbi:MAG: N-acetylmuramoyl-L-alanine amidase [Clostridia bacterium]|nr:N-acetylmuramoyl-L-alanine amidase [Clostridia bacterium]
MRIGINCGHTATGPGSGAVGILNESLETRAVGYALMEKLRGLGHTVIDCTNDLASSVSSNLSQITALANAQKLDAFYSIHFNAGGGRGSEVYTMGGEDVLNTARILESLSQLGFPNRGIKEGANLYVIRRTAAPAALIEVCFVDNEEDASLYQRLGPEQIADAICRGITGTNPEEKEELTMTQYQELKAAIDALTQKVQELNTPMIYNYIDENMPEWARASVKKMVDKGILKGDENGLGLTESDLRHIVWNDRAGLYD